MNTSQHKNMKRKRRHAKVRSKVIGTAERPRLSVFRSNTSIYAQIIDDASATTLVAANDSSITTGNKVERAEKVGQTIAEAAQAKNITAVVFDRGGYLFAGRVKALAEAARKAGLTF